MAKSKLKFLRCDCGRLLTDRVLSEGVCVGHKMKYAQTCSVMEFILIKIGVWEWVQIRKAKKERVRLESL